MYFAGVMVRLMLTLTPCVCVLSAIGFSRTLDHYLNDAEETKAGKTKKPSGVVTEPKKKVKEQPKSEVNIFKIMRCFL